MDGPILMSLFTLALLLPTLYKRHLRRTGAALTRTAQQNRKGRMAVAAVAALLVVGGVEGPRRPAGVDASGEERLVGVDVPDPRQQPAVHDQLLYSSGATAAYAVEIVAGEVVSQRFRAVRSQ